MTKPKSIILPAPQVNYLLTRITQIEQQKVSALSTGSTVEVRRAAAIKVVNEAAPEHVRNAYLAQLGYSVPGYRPTGTSLSLRVADAANKAAAKLSTSKQVLKVKAEATRLRDVIMLGGQPNELAKILSDFAAFEA